MQHLHHWIFLQGENFQHFHLEFFLLTLSPFIIVTENERLLTSVFYFQ